MESYDYHIFVCLGKRCVKKGAEGLLDLFKDEIKRRGLSPRVRISRSGCVKVCKETECEGEFSPVVIVYPEGVWYRNLSKKDVRDIIEEHIEGGRPVKRLLHFSLDRP